MAELTVGPVVIPRSPAASANCLNFQKHAGQAALKTAKKSKKMPNMVSFIVCILVPEDDYRILQEFRSEFKLSIHGLFKCFRVKNKHDHDTWGNIH